MLPLDAASMIAQCVMVPWSAVATPKSIDDELELCPVVACVADINPDKETRALALRDEFIRGKLLGNPDHMPILLTIEECENL